MLLLSYYVDDSSFTSFILEFCSYYKLVAAPLDTIQTNKGLSVYGSLDEAH